MAKILVLIRHGKAQAFKSEAEDASRTLTPAGRRALRASLPDALLPLALMPEFVMGETQVWSSPAVRAMETAEAAAAMLEVQEITAHQCLMDQDFEAFMAELAESPADVVVAVGHEPFAGVVAERLCGVPLPFKTAAVAVFDLSDYAGEPCDSVLRHFSQGPRTANWKTLTKIEDILCRSAAAVEETMALFLENPKDPEALHDFRVSIRTLRSELGFLKPYMNSIQAKSLQTKLRDLVVKTSRLRELDVFLGVVAESEEPNEELLAMVGKLRRKECKALLEQIGTKKAVKRACKLLDRVEHIEWKQHVEEMGLTPGDVVARFELIEMKFESAYLKTDYADAEATHDLRKAAKRVRYASREFASILGDVVAGVPEAMRDIQDELGALCDARVNCDIIDSLPRHKLSDAADTALAAIKQVQLDVILAILENDLEDSFQDQEEQEEACAQVQAAARIAHAAEAVEEDMMELVLDDEETMEPPVLDDDMADRAEEIAEALDHEACGRAAKEDDIDLGDAIEFDENN